MTETRVTEFFRSNIFLEVVTGTAHLSDLQWLAERLKSEGTVMSKTIVFCMCGKIIKGFFFNLRTCDQNISLTGVFSAHIN